MCANIAKKGKPGQRRGGKSFNAYTMRIEKDFNLRQHNTFGLDCRCNYFIESDSAEDFLELAASYDLPPEKILLLGGGSNFLFTEDFDGTVIYPTIQGMEIVREEGEHVWVKAGAGVVWDDFVAWAVENGFAGVENLSLIPGHVGASPVQNLGAYGMEAADTIYEVEAVDIQAAAQVTLSAADCCFAYRDSIFKHQWKNKYIITAVIFRLNKKAHFRLDYGSIRAEIEQAGGEVSLQAVRQAVIRIRNTKLPDVNVFPNAGSFFKNPVVSDTVAQEMKEKYPAMPLYPLEDGTAKLAAGWLIEQAGWKGKALGQAGVHDKQALVLINKGNATGIEIVRLANEIKKSVFLKFNVWLEPEVNIV